MITRMILMASTRMFSCTAAHFSSARAESSSALAVSMSGTHAPATELL